MLMDAGTGQLCQSLRTCDDFAKEYADFSEPFQASSTYSYTDITGILWLEDSVAITSPTGSQAPKLLCLFVEYLLSLNCKRIILK